VTFTDVYAARQVGTPMDSALHPTQIYESLACFLIFFFLLWLAPRKSFHGQVVLSYAVLYSTFRFTVEFFRGDPDRGSVFGGLLSTSQLIALLLVLASALVFPYVRRTQRVTPVPPAG
jgi:phosphatidylglycerol:prolipoprotein diacylglycerol transferase